MGTIHGIDNYSDNFKEHGKKILEETAAELNKAGIKVFPQVYTESNNNVDSCIINKSKNNKTENKKTDKGNKSKNHQDNKKAAKWIREAMPTYNNHESMTSTIMSNCKSHLGEILKSLENQTPDDFNEDDIYTLYDIQDTEDDTSGIDKLSNASDDEGEGNLLQTFFEKEVQAGFHTSNFAGTKYQKAFEQNTCENEVVVYSDNMYQKGKTSIIFGGTIDASHSNTNDNDIDYNAYSYGKYKAKRFTFGLGAMNTKTDDINDLNISIGAQHNGTGIYAILQKELNFIPGAPVHSQTNVKIGIGKDSGLLNPDDYNKKNKSIEEIDEIDEQKGYVESQEGQVYAYDDIDYKSAKDNTVVNLIINDTNNCKEYGIKGGYIFRKVTKKGNFAFIMPYGQISNTSVDSKEGATFVVGANAGQSLDTKNGWNLTTKAMLEASRHVVCGQKPSDYLLANVNFKANKNKFSGELSVGAYMDDDTYCKYLETKLNYEINKNLNASLKAGLTDYKFGESKNRDLQIAAGVHYSF